MFRCPTRKLTALLWSTMCHVLGERGQIQSLYLNTFSMIKGSLSRHFSPLEALPRSLTCGSPLSPSFSLSRHFLTNTWISLFSLLVVKSRLPKEEALSSHLFLEKVKATTGSWSFLRSISTTDRYTGLSCKLGKKMAKMLGKCPVNI